MTSGVITPGSGIALDPNRRSRTYELVLLGAATVVTGTSLALVEWAQEQRVTLDLAKYVVAFVVLYGAAHYAVRRFAPYADPVILPVVAMLNGLGLVLIHRLDLGNAHAENGRVTETQEANQQILWTLLGLAVLVAVLALLLGWFYVSWRFHTFRITGDDVEVRTVGSQLLWQAGKESEGEVDVTGQVPDPLSRPAGWPPRKGAAVAVDVGDGRQWWQQLNGTVSSLDGSWTDPALGMEVADRLEYDEEGSPFVPGRGYPQAHDVALDVATGICVEIHAV